MKLNRIIKYALGASLLLSSQGFAQQQSEDQQYPKQLSIEESIAQSNARTAIIDIVGAKFSGLVDKDSMSQSYVLEVISTNQFKLTETIVWKARGNDKESSRKIEQLFEISGKWFNSTLYATKTVSDETPGQYNDLGKKLVVGLCSSFYCKIPGMGGTPVAGVDFGGHMTRDQIIVFTKGQIVISEAMNSILSGNLRGHNIANAPAELRDQAIAYQKENLEKHGHFDVVATDHIKIDSSIKAFNVILNRVQK